MKKQLGLNGKPKEIPTKKQRLTKKEAWRRDNGYDENNECGDCVYFTGDKYDGIKPAKCRKIGLTEGAATDIKAVDMACKKYIEL